MKKRTLLISALSVFLLGLSSCDLGIVPSSSALYPDKSSEPAGETSTGDSDTSADTGTSSGETQTSSEEGTNSSASGDTSSQDEGSSSQPTIQYTITFDKNGGTGTMQSVTKNAGASYTLPNNGFTAPSGQQFKTWSIDNVEKAVGATITVNSDLTVKAIWENIPVATYTVTYKAGEGTGDDVVINDVTGTYALANNTFTAPSGQQFKAWKIGTTEYQPNAQVTISENTTVTAVWENIPVTQYTITFAPNGGTGEMDPVQVPAGDYVLPECEFTAPDEKQFKAWSINSVEKAVGQTIEISANTEVTAVWKDIPPVTYTVTYTANGGTGSDHVVPDVAGSYLLVGNTFFTRSNYHFIGWQVNEEVETRAVGYELNVTANVTVKALWEEDVHYMSSASLVAMILSGPALIMN